MATADEATQRNHAALGILMARFNTCMVRHGLKPNPTDTRV